MEPLKIVLFIIAVIWVIFFVAMTAYLAYKAIIDVIKYQYDGDIFSAGLCSTAALTGIIFLIYLLVTGWNVIF